MNNYNKAEADSQIQRKKLVATRIGKGAGWGKVGKGD